MSYGGRCSFCGCDLWITDAEWHRELGRCPGCGLNTRMRGITLALSKEIYGDTSEPLNDRSDRKEVRILGISDSILYARPLEAKFTYLNTFFHQRPFLDICDGEACRQYRGNRIIICSDVMEHTILRPIPVLRNLLSMLEPGGSLILSAPTFDMDHSIEWYGAMVHYSIEKEGEGFVLRWENQRGQSYIDEAPIFHGGAGETAELRLLSHSELEANAARLGSSAQTLPFQPEWGYSWPLAPQFPYLDAPGDGRIIVCHAH